MLVKTMAEAADGTTVWVLFAKGFPGLVLQAPSAAARTDKRARLRDMKLR